jgi:Zn-dependent protease with chaperone function
VLLTAEGVALLGLAATLAGPVPAVLARASWPARSPRAALVLWQAVGLSGGLAILGAGLTLAVSGLGRSWLGGLGALPAAIAALRLGPLGWAGAALTAVTGAWLLAVLARSTARLALARRAHRQRLDLLADELAVADLPAMAGAGRGSPVGAVRVRLLDHPLAAAYCLPGVRPRIVLSRGVVDVLSRAELCAVVSHENAHARGRHDLVIQPFRAWRQTFPFLAAGRAALAAVELLVELAADDAATSRGQRAALGSALRALAAATADAAAGGQVRVRERRLAAPPRPLPRAAAGAVCAAAAALVCLPAAILIMS